MLGAIRGGNVSTALITGKDSLRTHEILERFGLRDAFDAVFCGDTVQRPKPNPESVRLALAACQAREHEAVMIGDALSDIVAAKRAGVAAIGVTWGVAKREHFAALETEYVVDRPEEIVDIVLRGSA